MSCNLGSYKGWLLTFTTISCESSYFEWLSFLLTLEDNNKMNSISNVCLHTLSIKTQMYCQKENYYEPINNTYSGTSSILLTINL